MIAKFQSYRNPNGSASNIIGQVVKKSGDKWLAAVDYQKVLDETDYINACTVTATKVSDDSNVTSSFTEQFVTGNLLTGTATGGSTTQLIDTTKNFSSLGVQRGDAMLNLTKAQRMLIDTVRKTTNLGDTVTFFAQLQAAANLDVWKLLYCPRYIKAGTDGEEYLVTFAATAQSGQTFTDSILVTVSDA